MSPLVTGELSDLIFVIRPFSLNSRDLLPAARKVSKRLSAKYCSSLLFNFFYSFKLNFIYVYNLFTFIFKVMYFQYPTVGSLPLPAIGCPPTPPPGHNFDEIIEVSSRDEFWHRKWTTDENGRVVRRATAAEVCQTGDADDVHLPSPSYWPVVVAAGLPLVGFGLLYNLWICVPGTILVLIGVYAWVFEPPDDPDGPFGGGHGDEGHGETEESASDESAPQEEAASVE